MNLNQKKIAIVHDYLYVYGGAERVLEALHEIFPNAPIYTTYYVKDKLPKSFSTWNIKETYLGKIFIKNTWFRRFYSLFTYSAIRKFNFSEYDLIISITAGPAKNIRVTGKTKHISYILTPPWFEWGIAKPRFRKKIYLWLSRMWDYKASQQPDKLIAISHTVQKRIKSFYKRDSTIIFPPVEIEHLRRLIQEKVIKKNYLLMCGRLEFYKGVSTVAKILEKQNIEMKIAGSGDDAKNLIGLSKRIEYLGFVDDQTKAKLMSEAKALIFWNEDDFGLTMVEALSCGTPVIAFGKGGALDIISDGKNGILLKYQTEKELLRAIKQIDSLSLDAKEIALSAERFSKDNFKKAIIKFVNSNL